MAIVIPAGVPVMGMSAFGRGGLKGFMNIHDKVDMCVGKLVDGDSPFAFEALVENRCGHCGEPIEAGTTQVVAGIKGNVPFHPKCVLQSYASNMERVIQHITAKRDTAFAPPNKNAAKRVRGNVFDG